MAITRLGPNQDITAAKIAGQINFKNLIINGDMSIAQRGTSVTGLANSPAFIIDRFSYRRSGTWTTVQYTMSQETDAPTGQGFVKSLKITPTTAEASVPNDAFSAINYAAEGQDLQLLKYGTSNAESLTLSFWVKSNKTGTYVCAFKNSSSSDKLISKAYTIDSSNTWEKKSITIPGDTDGSFDNNNLVGLNIYWGLAAGSDFTSGSLSDTWQTTSNANFFPSQTVNLADSTSNEWYITGVQLEADTSASDFEFLPYDVNLRRCYRYYEKSYDYESPPPTNTEVSSMAINGLDQGTKQLRSVPVKHLETKRATPTITIYDVPGNSGKINTLDSGGTTATNQSFTGILANGKNSFNWYIGSTDKEGYIYHYTADAEL